MRVLFLGDTHGNLNFLDAACAKASREKCDLVFQVGDWGYCWMGRSQIHMVDAILERHEMKMCFIDGNHDDFYQLMALGMWGSTEPAPASDKELCFYYPRGYRWTWDGVSFLSLGGAPSVDKHSRRQGLSWFPEEEITEGNIIACGLDPVDVMITHEAPYGIESLESFLQLTEHFWPQDRILVSLHSRQAVAAVVDTTNPKLLTHGHYHHRYSGEYHTTKIEGLHCDQAPIDLSTYILDTKEFLKEIPNQEFSS